MKQQRQAVWRPPVAASRCSSRNCSSTAWPIHDLVVTELLAWILPTHMQSHLIRFVVVLIILWCGSLWLLLQRFLPQLKQAEELWLLVPYSFLIGALSVAWCVWYHRSVLFAIGKPWMDPQVPAINRLEMHVPLRIFDSVEKARRAACLPHMVAWNSTPKLSECDQRTGADCLTRNVLLLDSLGSWQFQLLFSVEEGLALVRKDARNVRSNHNAKSTGDWAPIEVPGHWMLQGFNDIPIYTNKKYPFPPNPPIVPRENPTGVYKLLVELPSFWKHSTEYEYSIILHGVESACFVYWNGQPLGFFKDSRLPSEFRIPPDLLQSPTAVLHLVVARWSDGSYMEDQDHWWMAGVHRSIELIRRPVRADILDYRVLATASRELSLAVHLRKNSLRSTLTVKLYEDRQLTPDGDQWIPAQEELWSQSKQVDRSTKKTLTFESSSIQQVKLWTAETPNLYSLVLIQSDAITGEIFQVESCRIGFRSMDINGDGILRVNGQRITICGINRHEHDPDHGKVVSLDRMKQDIITLKYVVTKFGRRIGCNIDQNLTVSLFDAGKAISTRYVRVIILHIPRFTVYVITMGCALFLRPFAMSVE